MLLSFNPYYNHYHYCFNLNSNEVDSQSLYKTIISTTTLKNNNSGRVHSLFPPLELFLIFVRTLVVRSDHITDFSSKSCNLRNLLVSPWLVAKKVVQNRFVNFSIYFFRVTKKAKKKTLLYYICTEIYYNIFCDIYMSSVKTLCQFGWLDDFITSENYHMTGNPLPKIFSECFLQPLIKQ